MSNMAVLLERVEKLESEVLEKKAALHELTDAEFKVEQVRFA